MKVEKINPAPTPLEIISIINKNNNKKEIDDNWKYFDKNKDFLLRFCLIKNENSDELIRFEVLNTKKISETFEMYAQFFSVDYLAIKLEVSKKNIDIFTYILMIFDKNPPEGEINENKNEFILKITKDNKIKNEFILVSTMCEDENFLKKNMSKKLKQLEDNLENNYNKLKEENNALIKKNDVLKKELNKIIEGNENLSKNNSIIYLELLELEKSQDKAEYFLSQLQN